jgi:hypothetical protein
MELQWKLQGKNYSIYFLLFPGNMMTITTLGLSFYLLSIICRALLPQCMNVHKYIKEQNIFLAGRVGDSCPGHIVILNQDECKANHEHEAHGLP